MINKKNIFLCMFLILYSSTSFAIIVQNTGLGINQRTTVLATPITQADTSPIRITVPGCYKLGSNLINKQIIIDADDVTLLFNGFSMNNPSLNADAIVINLTHSDIIIQGGEISGQNFANRAGINILSGCSHILIQNIKISSQFYGVLNTLDNDVLIRLCTMTNCNYGVFTNSSQCLRIKQCMMGAPDLASTVQTYGIWCQFSADISIDLCTITACAYAMFIAVCTSTFIKDCTVNDLLPPSGFFDTIGILFSRGSANIIDNCLINNIRATFNNPFGAFVGIFVRDEDASIVRNCTVNNIFPDVGITMLAIGILIQRTLDVAQNTDFCIVHDNVVSNIFGNDPISTSYGYALADFRGTPTNYTFINNRAINCTNANTQPYTPNISYVVNAPQATFFPWNWIRS